MAGGSLIFLGFLIATDAQGGAAGKSRISSAEREADSTN